MRVAWAVLVSMLVLVAAGCGSEDVGAGEASAAELVKPGALVYWELDSDPESDQWQQVEELLRRFPDGEKWIADLRKSWEKDVEVTWEETKEALGGDSAVVLYAKSMTDFQFVGLLHPDDVDKTMAFVEKANQSEDDPDDRLIARKVDDWVVVSDEEASIDAALKTESGQALADVQSFQDGMAKLPEDSLSRVYVDVAKALDTFGSAEPDAARAFQMLGLNQIDFAGAWAKARDDGAELAGAVSGEGADRLLGAADEYSSNLLDLVPADAFAFASFQGKETTAQLESFSDNPLYAQALREFEREVGVKLTDVVRLFQGEVAFYAAPGAPIPELTLLIDAENPQQARESADRILRALAQQVGGEVTEDGDVTTVAFGGVSINVATVDETLVVTTSKAGISMLREGGDKLADADRFKEALDAAGVPDQYTGLFYVDLAEAIELAMGFASTSGETIPPEVSRNLEPLRSLVAYGDKDGELGKSLLFVEIE
jgi:Protein of unknown function (DUF3352)